MNQLVTTITAAEAVPHDPETGEITEVSMNTEITPPAAKRKMPLQPILNSPCRRRRHNWGRFKRHYWGVLLRY